MKEIEILGQKIFIDLTLNQDDDIINVIQKLNYTLEALNIAPLTKV